MAASLPRGIQLLSWKNKDKSKSVKYRVRIKRKDFSADNLFDTLEEAKEYLNNSKTKDGLKAIEFEKSERQAEIYGKVITEFLNRVDLKYFAKLYIENYVDTIVIDNPMKSKGVSTIKSALKTFLNTELNYENQAENKEGKMFWWREEKALGDWKVHEITHIVLDAYIRKRLNTDRLSTGTKISKGTVIAELSIVKKFFSKLSKIDFERFKDFDYSRPFERIDHDLLKNSRTKRDFVIQGEDEKKLMKVIAEYSNPELRQVILLSLYTGMRNSEVLTLKCNQIKKDGEKVYINLTITKSKKPRRVFLNLKARNLIDEFNIEDFNSDKPVFTYKMGGFEGSFRAVRKTNGLQHIKFHDLRRTMITNTLLEMGKDSSVLISEFLGISNPAGMVKEYSTSELKMENQADLQNSIGHTGSNKDQITKIYTTIM